MKKKICISLVLYNNKYINKFSKYSFKTILENLNEQKKNFEFIFLIATKKKNIKKIKNIFLKENLQFKINLISESCKKYKIVTDNQIYHIKSAKKYNYDFLIFIYADMLFSKKSFLSALRILNNKKIYVVCTFALLLSSRNKKFKKFFFLIKNKKNLHLKFLTKNKDLISKYHQAFQEKELRFEKSFIYKIENNNLYIKTFHYHPFILRLKNITEHQFIYKFETIDNYFLENFNKKNVYVENNLSKISIFSFDYENRESQNYKFDFKDFSFKKKVVKLILLISALNKSSLEKYLFRNNTLKFSLNYKNFIFGNFDLIKNGRLQIWAFCLKKMYDFYKSSKDIKIVIVGIYFIILLYIGFNLSSFSKLITFIKKKFKLKKNFLQLEKNYSNLNLLFALILLNLIYKLFYFKKWAR